MRIRKAKHSDVDRVTALWCEFMDFHAGYDPCFTRRKGSVEIFKKYLHEQISSRKALLLVAEDHKDLIGYLLAKIEERPPVFELRRIGFISDTAVTGDIRNKGVGTRLYKESLKWFKKRNVDRVELIVATTNPISTRFWKKLGFKSYTERKYIEI
jgi:ribosomal protein S18 acetylase RimI-like enzyme